MSAPLGKFRTPRIWSNKQLRMLAPFFAGAVINVSGADDDDKEGEKYQSYFKAASSYSISNWSTEFRGYKGRDGEILLDLESPEISHSLVGQFSTAFCHTTLEHVFNVRQAVKTLCSIATDHVVVVVPFAQVEHGPPNFGDFWRFSPMGLSRLFEEEGWRTSYLAGNLHLNSAIYLFYIASADQSGGDALREFLESAQILGSESDTLYLHPDLRSEPAAEPLGAWIGQSSRSPRREWNRRVVRSVVGRVRRNLGRGS